MKNPEKLIGKKVRGFKFETTKYCGYTKGMDKYVGKTGIIDKILEHEFRVDFKEGYYYYPADQIEAHLVEDEIPTLSDGVMMLVSDDENTWHERNVFAKRYNIFYAWGTQNIKGITTWNFCKPLEPTKEEQLTAILGSDEKVSQIMELFNDKK